MSAARLPCWLVTQAYATTVAPGLRARVLRRCDGAEEGVEARAADQVAAAQAAAAFGIAPVTSASATRRRCAACISARASSLATAWSPAGPTLGKTTFLRLAIEAAAGRMPVVVVDPKGSPALEATVSSHAGTVWTLDGKVPADLLDPRPWQVPDLDLAELRRRLDRDVLSRILELHKERDSRIADWLRRLDSKC
ncbi:MAG TPA: hypothetical protein VGK33_21590 [Chloroflexota bacterium]